MHSISLSTPYYINDRWRITADDRQWILEYRKGQTASSKSSGWSGRSFHRHRNSLLRRINHLCGEVPVETLDALADLPERFP